MQKLEINNRALRDMRISIQLKTSKLINQLQYNNEAYTIFRFGFFLRLGMIIESQHQLKKLLELKNTKHKDTTLENIYINSFYINLFGAFDNLAWTIKFGLNLLEPSNRSKIGLFKPEFLKELQKNKKITPFLISEYKEWYLEIQKLRDPSAHRLPLYCPPAMMDQNDLQEYRLLENRTENSSFDINLFHKMQTLGTYHPIFILNSDSGKNNVIYTIEKTIYNDYARFLKLVNIVLDWIDENKINMDMPK